MPAKRFPSMLGLAVVTAFGLVALQSGEGYAAPAAPSSSTGLAVVAVPADFVQGDDDTASDDWSGHGSQEQRQQQEQEQSQSGGSSSESSTDSGTGSSSSDDD
ncbi:hypothetical protein GCM10009530_49130 [Microbispora corallina]|uniref:Secreted protein n=1 Tax=Microbispora corallina TaxID=83302 RepID=A0ABQ4FQP6_9ACTN|nr:hypothetical protein [Microbispora corallina]GIH37136.1 hypothetical protein Mco01_01360 [Microbispora corallina]